MTPSFVFYDYETTGVHPGMDRPIQFAACTTDRNFNPLEQHEFKCRLAGDVIPSPVATLIHGQSPRVLQSQGVSERDFAQRINGLFTQGQQIIMGYNTAQFDDPFTQHLFYRNFYDPYGWQWREGNQRYDLLVAVRCAHLFAQDALIWPERDGLLSMKLEDLAPANDIQHLNAHDALGDTLATRDLAHLIAQRAPDLWQECLSMASKKVVQERIETAMATHGALLLVDGMFGRDRAYAGLVYPIGNNPDNPSEVWCIDLGMDLSPLVDYSAEQLKHYLYLAKQDRQPEDPRVPFKRIRTNRATAVFSLEKLGQHPEVLALAGIDRGHFKAQRDWVRLQPLDYWMELASQVIPRSFDPADFVDAQLFDDMIGNNDANRLASVRQAEAVDLMADPPTFDDPRLNAMLPLYIARNFTDQLGPKARKDWQRYCTGRWKAQGRWMNLDAYLAEMQELAGQNLPEEQVQMLQELEVWVQRMAPPL